MGEGKLFSADTVAEAERFRLRLWLADVVDLALAGVLGWAAVRAGDWVRTVGALLGAGGAVWLVMSVVGGWSGWTAGRAAGGMRLVRGEGVAPGVWRGLVRGLVVPVELLVGLVLQRRLVDRLLGLHGEEVAGRQRWRGLAWVAPWGLALAGAVYFFVMPTRDEALRYLVRLPGWRCCHGRATSWRCEVSVDKAVREALEGHEHARAVAIDCPRARKFLDPE